jgi:hypothetical protein
MPQNYSYLKPPLMMRLILKNDMDHLSVSSDRFINWVGSYFTYNGGGRLIIRSFVKEDKPHKSAATLKTDSKTQIYFV